MCNKPYHIVKSLLAPDLLAQQIASAYGLTQVRCQLLTATMRDVYAVTTAQRRFVLFVYPYRYRTREQILAEWQFVAFLAAHEVPVAPALASTQGDIVLKFDAPEGERYGVLSAYLSGDILRRRSSPQTVQHYGSHIATIHILADTLPSTLARPANEPEVIVQQALAATEAALPDRANVLTTLHYAHDILLPKLQALVPTLPNYGMIHGDVIRANAIVAPDGTVSVIDFDLCGLGWRAYDVASYLFAIRGTSDEPALRAAFLAGYTDVRPLSQPEQTMLPLFETVRAVFDIGIPARYVNSWGRAYVDASLDGSITQLNQCLDRLLDG